MTEVLIRRQHFRDMETPSLSYLLGSLPSLRVLRRENWRRFGVEERREDAARYGPSLDPLSEYTWREGLLPFVLTAKLPTSLTHLQLFQDFDAQLYGQQEIRAPLFSPMNTLLPMLARSTPNLQAFAASFLADAIDIFDLRNSYLLKHHDGTIRDEATRQRALDTRTHYFPNMEFVAVTAQEHLRLDQDHGKINAFLRAAAAVALKMPKLKTMELWNCGQGHACVFRYEAADPSGPRPERSCRLTWRSTWGARDLVVGRAVLEAWEGVARARGHPAVLFGGGPLPVGAGEREYASHHGLLRVGGLRLARYVLHETSRAQAEAEADLAPDAYMWYTGY